MMSISVRHVCSGLIAAFVASGCQSDDVIVNNQVLGVVVTLVDSGPALRSARTFALPDTVMLVPRSGTPISLTAAQQIAAAVRAHFIALGWTDIAQTTRQSRPDVVVLIAASTQIRSTLIYSDWFVAWGFLPYWSLGVDPSWVWASSASEFPFTYQAGTLIITMLDVRAQDSAAKRIPVLWSAGLDGVVSDPSSATLALTGIAQAFAQSPYLRRD
jgi:hypothetical protein